MALHLAGLDPDDVAEIVECLLLGSAHAAQDAPGLAGRRRELADTIGDALDALPPVHVDDEPTRPTNGRRTPTAPPQKRT
ncbi:hypothetical protein [Streptomyces sp. NBC_01763]|uniref:hypothetical protein n=1 Tax=Streptomyces sp. NBC_01763 TaxID=2975934 RepID=UPI002DD863F2|nr:hypothetical protein [Streptomyces sp. NBC_01763]WSC35669.1 hypothetical protein OHA08_09230 [Streptomyces sp. NBC_01763]